MVPFSFEEKHRIPMAGDRGGDASDTEQCQAGTEEVPLAGVSMLVAQALVVHDSIARSCRHRVQGSSAECAVGVLGAAKSAEKKLKLCKSRRQTLLKAFGF